MGSVSQIEVPRAKRRSRLHDDLNIGQSDVIINLRGLHKTTVNVEEATAMIEAAALNGDVMMEAHKAKKHIGIGYCFTRL